MSVTREALDQLRCGGQHPEGHPDCDHDALYMHSRCHHDVPTWAVYSNGELRIECAECGENVVTVEVAARVGKV